MSPLNVAAGYGVDNLTSGSRGPSLPPTMPCSQIPPPQLAASSLLPPDFCLDSQTAGVQNESLPFHQPVQHLTTLELARCIFL